MSGKNTVTFGLADRTPPEPPAELQGAGESPVEMADDMIASLRAADAQNAYVAQMAEDDRLSAADAGLDIEVWQTLTPEQRRQIVTRKVKETERGGAVRTVQISAAQLKSMGGNAAQFDALARRLIPDEAERRKTTILMADPWEEVEEEQEDGTIVTNRYHPGVSIIYVAGNRDVLERKRAQGFWERPIYPFRPDPHLPCKMVMPGGAACNYKGRTRLEVEEHVRWSHPNQWKAQQESFTLQAQQAQVEEVRLSREVMQQQMAALQAMVASFRNNGGAGPSEATSGAEILKGR